jgi:hypothetical protein
MESTTSRKRFFGNYLCYCRRVCSRTWKTYRAPTGRSKERGRNAKDRQERKDREIEKGRREALIGPTRKLPDREEKREANLLYHRR